MENVFFHSVQVTCSIAQGAGSVVPGAQDQSRIVLHLGVPEVRAEQSRVQWKGPGYPVRQVEQVHALID